ncbi:hypothetical protein I0P70_02745 [Pontibacter sp. FD36]|uniref:hypothetical protein n=1 Tax=Pontibacter sp. FD36 TaxID=2789860 RepID=UPI0018AC7CBA|nr:hypothetical protein [Pontibacter sp. FD36]MBF8962152.1 hypothetical protein [Pontibacter sp. FD36]
MMEILLNNEVLFRSNSLEIKKTYDKTSDRYGLYCSDGKRLAANYLHIFPYTPDELAPAIKADNEFVWINLELEEEPMLQKDKWLWACCVPANSKCNCLDDGTILDCTICEAGSIFNTLNFKTVSLSSDKTIYEYDTRDNTYRITLTKSDATSNLLFDYKWEAAEVEQQLRWTIDSYELLKGEHKYNLNVCVYEYLDGNVAVQLTLYAVKIDFIDTSILMDISKDRIVLGFDDFPYNK